MPGRASPCQATRRRLRRPRTERDPVRPHSAAVPARVAVPPCYPAPSVAWSSVTRSADLRYRCLDLGLQFARQRRITGLGEQVLTGPDGVVQEALDELRLRRVRVLGADDFVRHENQ